MPVNPYYERLNSAGFGWVIYAMFAIVVAGIALIVIGLIIAPGPLLLVGILLFGFGIWAVSPLFSDTSRKSRRRRNLPQALRMEVWKKYNGRRIKGGCYVCQRPITRDNFETGHNIAQSKGGRNTVANLRAICGVCNKAMGTMSIETYKKKLIGAATTHQGAKPPKA